jgi:hypothetical protein
MEKFRRIIDFVHLPEDMCRIAVYISFGIGLLGAASLGAWRFSESLGPLARFFFFVGAFVIVSGIAYHLLLRNVGIARRVSDRFIWLRLPKWLTGEERLSDDQRNQLDWLGNLHAAEQSELSRKVHKSDWSVDWSRFNDHNSRIIFTIPLLNTSIFHDSIQTSAIT